MKFYNYLRSVIVGCLVVIIAMSGSVLAQSTAPDPDAAKDFCNVTTDASDSAFCSESSKRFLSTPPDPTIDKTSPILGPTSILYRVIQTLTMLTGVISVVMIIIGGFKYVTSGGDSNATKSAKDTILYAVVGLIVAIFAQTIVIFVLSKL